MTTCPQCKGRKQVIVTIEEFGKPGETKFDMPCPTCEGKGEVTPAQAQEHAAAVDAWCQCANVDFDRVRFHDDTPTMKHHYTCGDCGKIVQVG